MKLRIWIVFGIVALSLCTRNAFSQETLVVDPKASEQERLSPELDLLTKVNGQLLGLTKQNRAVIRVQQSAIESLTMSSKSVSPESDPEFEEVELLVSYSESDELQANTLEEAELTQIDKSESGNFLVVQPEGVITAKTINTLLGDEAVTYVEPNYILTVPDEEFVREVEVVAGATNQTPNDPMFPQLWGMQNINAEAAWNCITDAPEVVVAIIDTGVDYKHQDLRANMWQSPAGTFGYDFYDDDNDPMDEQNHGTHCAGTVAAVGNNGIGVVGVAWKTKIMAMRFLGPTGSGSSADAIDCIDWAVEHGAHILSNSWGGGGFSQNLQDAITRAEKKGVLFVAAAGNSNSNNDSSPHYPSSYSNNNIIAVGAIETGDFKSSFSSYGKKSVDIGAPGTGILSTILNNKYATFNGTSMATPHVAGAAALAWKKEFSVPEQDVTQMKTVRNQILANARAVTGLEDRWGHTATVKGGVLNVEFLCDDPIPTPPADCCPIVASAQFDPFSVTATGNQTLAEVALTLKETSIVHITANTSVTAQESALFTLGFSNQTADHIWVPSLRFIQVKDEGSWVNGGSTVSVKLPAGKHVLRWNVWAGASKLEFDAGSMLVQAYAVGGTAGAAMETTTAADLAFTKDELGNVTAHSAGRAGRTSSR